MSPCIIGPAGGEPSSYEHHIIMASPAARRPAAAVCRSRSRWALPGRHIGDGGPGPPAARATGSIYSLDHARKCQPGWRLLGSARLRAARPGKPLNR
jgi:hypothetical protein